MPARLRLIAINTFIACLVAALIVDALPQSPLGLQIAIRPLLLRLGIYQGPWSLFAPDPDRRNLRLRAEITYRDDQEAKWVMPDWRQATPWEMFLGHRRRAWWRHIVSAEGGPTWEASCRYLARTQRPDLPDADRGARVRLIYQEAILPPAEQRPWTSFREPTRYDDGWILTTKELE